MKSRLFKTAGYTSVALAFAGAFVPVMPTTPFLLLAVYCFSKSDPRMNRWLRQNRRFGRYLRDYESGRGIPAAVKISTLVTMWSTMAFTAVVLTDETWLKAILLTVGLLVTVHIVRIKTSSDEKENPYSRPDSARNRAVRDTKAR